MADVTEAPVWARNAEGQALVKLVSGSAAVAGYLGADSVPLDENGAMVMSVGGDLNVRMDSTLAGEDLDKQWLRIEAGATQNKTVLSGKVDFLLGSVGAGSDYLKRINAVVNDPTASRVVLKEGLPNPKKQINTHGSTASTTTVINTAVNSEIVTVDQFKDHLIRVGTNNYRKILSHPAFAGGAVNSFTLDEALPSVPAANTPCYIENPDLVIEVLPNGVAKGTHEIVIERYCTGDGWRVSTANSVTAFNSGDFDNV